MHGRIGSRLTFSNVLASLALFVALGGTSDAVNEISRRDVKNNSLTGSDVENGSLTVATSGTGR